MRERTSWVQYKFDVPQMKKGNELKSNMEIWTTKEGRKIKICDMETSHIENCIKMLERNARDGVLDSVNLGYDGDDDFQTYDEYVVYGREYLDITQYKVLKRELKKRKI